MKDLITLEEYKIAKGIQGMKEDSRLKILIKSVSQLVKTYCNNTFIDHYPAPAPDNTNNGENEAETVVQDTTPDTRKTDVFNLRYGEDFVQLTESPVVNTPEVYERANLSEDYVQLVENKDYYVDQETDSIYRTTDTGFSKSWPSGPGSVKVLYNAGYENVPEDLKLAVIDLTTYYHKDEHKARQTIAGASIQNNASTSQRNNVAFPDHIKRVLDLYKNF